jgi:Tfp pilus assembly protein PilN
MAQQINLYRARLVKKQATLPSLGILKIGVGLVVVVLLLSALSVWRTNALQSDIAALEQDQAEARSNLEQIGRRVGAQGGNLQALDETTKLKALIAAPQSVRELLEKDVFTSKQGYSDFFIALARQSVQGVQLTRVNITGAGKDIEIIGRATSPERVPRYLQRLSREKIMGGLEFGAFQISQPAPLAEDDAAPTKQQKSGLSEVAFVLRTKQPLLESKP